jgi:mutator protein MutT
VFSYTDFEGRVLREGGARYRDLAPALDTIAIRLVDLHVIARSHYYHPAQNGSWSIKRLLPTIAPDLDYANLDEVADGTSAQIAYLEMVDAGTGDERRGRLADTLSVLPARHGRDGADRAAFNRDRYNLPMALISVLAAVVRRNDKYLVCQRPTHKRHGGLWEFPGGKREPGETYLDAAKRELAEELGVEAIAVGSPLRSIADPGSAFLIEFVPTEIVGEPHCLEHIDLKWLPVEQLSSLQLAPSDQRFVEFLRSQA